MLLEKLTIAFGDQALAKELIERFEKDDIVGLDEAKLASALGSLPMAQKILKSAEIDEAELANCLASPELAKALLGLREPKDQAKKPRKRRKQVEVDAEKVAEAIANLDQDGDGDVDAEDLSILEKAAKKLKKIVKKD